MNNINFDSLIRFNNGTGVYKITEQKLLYQRPNTLENEPVFSIEISSENPPSTGSRIVSKNVYKTNDLRNRTASSSLDEFQSLYSVSSKTELKMFLEPEDGIYLIRHTLDRKCIASIDNSLEQLLSYQTFSDELQNVAFRFLVRKKEDQTYTIRDCYSEHYLGVNEEDGRICGIIGQNGLYHWRFRLLGDNIVALYNVETNLCISMNTALGYLEGALLNIFSSSSSSSSSSILSYTFSLERDISVPVLGNGIYHIAGIGGRFWERAMNMSVHSTLSYSNAENNYQQFHIRNIYKNVYTIQVEQDLTFLGVSNQTIVSSSWSNQLQFYWVLERNLVGRFRLRNLSNSLYISIEGETDNIILDVTTLSDAELWTFHIPITEGVYQIYDTTTLQCMSLHNNNLSDDEGQTIYKLASKNASTAPYLSQRFLLKYVKNGLECTLKDCYSDKYLRALNGYISANTNVETTWRFHAVYGGLLLVTSNFQQFGTGPESSTLIGVDNGQCFGIVSDTFSVAQSNGIYRIANKDGFFCQMEQTIETLHLQLALYSTIAEQQFRIRNLGDNVVTIQMNSMFLFESEQQIETGVVNENSHAIQWKLYVDDIGRFQIQNMESNRYIGSTIDTIVIEVDGTQQLWTFHSVLLEGIYTIKHLSTSQYISLPSANNNDNNTNENNNNALVLYFLTQRNSVDTVYHSQRFQLVYILGKYGFTYTLQDCYTEKYLSCLEDGSLGSTEIQTEWKAHAVNGGIILVNNGLQCYGISENSSVLTVVSEQQLFEFEEDRFVCAQRNGTFRIVNTDKNMFLHTIQEAEEKSLFLKSYSNDLLEFHVRNLGDDVVTIGIGSNCIQLVVDKQVLFSTQYHDLKTQWKLIVDNLGCFQLQNRYNNEFLGASLSTQYIETFSIAQLWSFHSLFVEGVYKLATSYSNQYISLQNNEMFEESTLQVASYQLNSQVPVSNGNTRYPNQRFLLKYTSIQMGISCTFQDCYSNKYLSTSNGTICSKTTPTEWTPRAVNGGYLLSSSSNVIDQNFIHSTQKGLEFLLQSDNTYTPLIQNGIYRIASTIGEFIKYSSEVNLLHLGTFSNNLSEEQKQQFQVRVLSDNIVTLQLLENVASNNGFLKAIDISSSIVSLGKWEEVSNFEDLDVFYWRLIKDTLGHFLLQNTKTNQYLTKNGTELSLTENRTFLENQLWTFHNNSITEGIYNFCHWSSGLYMSLSNNEMFTSSQFYKLETKNPGPTGSSFLNQRFQLKYVVGKEGWAYTIKDCYSDKYVTGPETIHAETTSTMEWIFPALYGEILLVQGSSCYGIQSSTSLSSLPNTQEQTWLMELETTTTTTISSISLQAGEYRLVSYIGDFLQYPPLYSNFQLAVFSDTPSEQIFCIRTLGNDIITIQSISKVGLSDGFLKQSGEDIVVSKWEPEYITYLLYWRLVPVSLGRFKIQHVDSGQFMTHSSQGLKMANEIIEGEEQLWTFHLPIQESEIYMITHLDTSQYISLVGNNLSEGNTYIFSSKNPVNTTSTTSTTTTEPYLNQRFQIQSVPNKKGWAYAIRDSYSGKYLVTVGNSICGQDLPTTEWRFHAFRTGLILVSAESNTLISIENEELFRLEKDTFVTSQSNGVYQLAGYNGAFWEVYRDTTGSNVEYKLYSNTLPSSQKFRIRNLGNNVVTIQCIDNSQFLNASSIGSIIKQNFWQNTENAHFYWELTRDSIGRYRFRNIKNNQYAEISNQTIVLSNENFTEQQLWTFHTFLEEGIYNIRQNSTSKYITLKNNEMFEEFSPDIYSIESKNAGTAQYFSQRFQLQYVSGMYGCAFTLLDCYSDKYVTVVSNYVCGKPENTTQWKLCAVNEGFVLISGSTGYGTTSASTSFVSISEIQTYTFERDTFVPLIPNGVYEVQSTNSSELVWNWTITDSNLKQTNRAPLNVAQSSGSVKQQFKVRNLGEDVVTLQIPAAYQYGFITIGLTDKILRQFRWNPTRAERWFWWKILESSPGSFRIQNRYYNEVVTVVDNSPVIQIDTNSQNQQFLFNRVMEPGVYNFFSSSGNILRRTSKELQQNTLFYNFISPTDVSTQYLNQRFQIQTSDTNPSRLIIKDFLAELPVPIYQQDGTQRIDLAFKFSVYDKNKFRIATNITTTTTSVMYIGIPPLDGKIPLVTNSQDAMQLSIRKDMTIPPLVGKTFQIEPKVNEYGGDIRCWDCQLQAYANVVPTSTPIGTSYRNFRIRAVAKDYVIFTAPNTNRCLTPFSETDNRIFMKIWGTITDNNVLVKLIAQPDGSYKIVSENGWVWKNDNTKAIMTTTLVNGLYFDPNDTTKDRWILREIL